MKIPQAYVEKLKWSIYEWLGAISISESTRNLLLARQVELLAKSLRPIAN